MAARLEAIYENGSLRLLTPTRLLEGQRVTVTVPDEALDAASDAALFVLPPDRWEAFCEALDRPARDLPELRKLFTETGPFDAPPRSL